MKLFHKTPEGGILKTGINITQVNYLDDRWWCKRFVGIYFAIEGVAWAGVYFFKSRAGGWRVTDFKFVNIKKRRRLIKKMRVEMKEI